MFWFVAGYITASFFKEATAKKDSPKEYKPSWMSVGATQMFGDWS